MDTCVCMRTFVYIPLQINNLLVLIWGYIIIVKMNIANNLLQSVPKSPFRYNLVQVRTSFTNSYRHGPSKAENPDPPIKQWVKDFFGPEGKEFIKFHAKRLITKPFQNHLVGEIKPGKLYKFEDFDSDEAIKRWKPVADSDTGHGFSTSKFVRSRFGHGLFTGVLDPRVPDNGLAQIAGCTGLIGPQKEDHRLIAPSHYWNWDGFNCLEIRFKGDGRKYALVCNTAAYDNDLEFYDCNSYPLYTHGGPYWQTLKIPFSRFVFNYKGLIQDQQGPLPTHKIKFVAITLQDNVAGPFSLEIDYIGVKYDHDIYSEDTAYEGYKFSHIAYKQVHVDCGVTE